MSSSAARGRFILQLQIHREFESLRGAGLAGVSKQSNAEELFRGRRPTVPLEVWGAAGAVGTVGAAVGPRVASRLTGSGPGPALGDRLWPLLLVSRLFGLSPVGPAPTYRPSTGWTLYCWLVYALTVSLNCYRMVTNLQIYITGERVAADLIPTSSPTVLIPTSAAYIANFFCNLTITLALGRKVRLLQRAMSFPVCAAASTHPSRSWLAIELFLVIFFYAGTNCLLLYFQPLSCLLPLFQFAGSLERLLLAHLVKRVGLCLSTANGELKQLADLVRRRSRLTARLPDLAGKIALIRSDHERATGMLKLLTKCYEVPLTCIILYDFISATTSAYLLMVCLTERNLNLLTVLSALDCTYSTTCTLILASSARWTHLQGIKTYVYVHDILNCLNTSEREIQQLTSFSFQLMHPTFRVTPLGIFDVDYTILSSMCTSILTYVIVLVQFGLPAAPSEMAAVANMTDVNLLHEQS